MQILTELITFKTFFVDFSDCIKKIIVKPKTRLGYPNSRLGDSEP